MNITAHSTHNTTICLCHKQLWFPNYQHLPYCQTIFSHLLSKLSDYHHCVTFQANSRVNKVTDWPLEMNCGVFSIFDQVRTKTNSGRGRVQVCQIMAPSQSLTWRKIQSISWNFWSSREMMWTKWKISFLSQCFMAFLWISKRGLSFQSTESFGQDNNSFCCQFLLRVAIALWVETHTLNRYLPGTRRGCIKMNLSPFGPPSLPKARVKDWQRDGGGSDLGSRNSLVIFICRFNPTPFVIQPRNSGLLAWRGPWHVVKFIIIHAIFWSQPQQNINSGPFMSWRPYQN